MMQESEKIPTMIEIDGSHGEGGGQVLRTALACSAVLKKPVRVKEIRAGRKNPGLQAQHLKSIEALAKLSRAITEGVQIGSKEVTFIPGEMAPGVYEFDIGTAGSVTLLLQALLLPLSLCRSESRLMLTGGTHVEWSPPFDYLSEVLLPTLALMGLQVEAKMERWGWYPKGNGRIHVKIEPTSRLNPISLNDRGSLKRLYGISAISNLPTHVAERQRERALRRIERELEMVADIGIFPSIPSADQGSFLLIIAESERIRAGFSSLGRRGKRAEEVADEVVNSLKDYIETDGCLDPHLSDQIVPFLAFAHGRSSFTTTRMTEHLLTNLWVIQHFLNLSVLKRGEKGEPGQIDLISTSY